jgi:hypothetical protein
VSTVRRGVNPIPQLVPLMMATAAYVIGRVQGRRHPVRVAAMVVLIILTMTLASGPRARRRPLVPPQDYGNANGARYVLGVAAAAIIARLSSRVPIRWVAVSLLSSR